MAKKNSFDYFESFVKQAEYACQAANLLQDIMMDFDLENLPDEIEKMHALEHAADEVRHIMIKRLAREFITPIEREDILALADAIDDVIDAIEDVLLRMYMCNISHVREDALKMSKILVTCCDALKQALEEFKSFRKSEILHDLIVQINQLEEEGDRLFTEATKRLYTQSGSAIEIAAWERTFYYLEKCYDYCEDVANLIEDVVLKNS